MKTTLTCLNTEIQINIMHGKNFKLRKCRSAKIPRCKYSCCEIITGEYSLGEITAHCKRVVFNNTGIRYKVLISQGA